MNRLPLGNFRIDIVKLAFTVLTLVSFGGAVPLWAADTHPAAPAHSSTAAEGHHEASHGIAHEEHGVEDHHGPYTLWADLPFWSAVAFIGFVLAIKGLGLWNVLLTSMSDREQAEGQAIALAEADLIEAKAALRSSQGRMEALDERIRETMAEAGRDASSTRDSIISIAEQEARAAMARAHVEIERVRDQSLSEIFESLADKVADVTESRLRSGLQGEDHSRLVGAVLDGMAVR